MGVADDEVRVEKVSKVLAATGGGGGKRRVVFLTSCDLVCRSYPYINRVFFFKEAGQVPLQVSVMKEGLARALVSFYPLAGRFFLDEEGRLEIDCCDVVADDEEAEGGGGAEFVEASCDLPFASLLLDGFQYRHLFWKLARRTHYLRCDYLHEPILSVQVTKFSGGGGYSVGVSMSHAVADAQSFFDFVKCWGEVCRGVAMSTPPLHIRDALSVSTLFPSEKFESSAVPNGRIGNSDLQPSVLSMQPRDHKVVEGQLLPASRESQNGRTVVNDLVKELEQIGLVTKTAVRTASQSGKAATRTRAPIMEKQMEEEEHRRPRADLVQRVFSFSLEKLQQLKQRANANTNAIKNCWPSNINGSISNSTEVLSKVWNDDVSNRVENNVSYVRYGFTTFEAFCAHWWQCFIRARRLPATQAVFLLIPINCRQRFLGLPQSYFGNALDGGLVKLSAGELCEAEVGVVASKIHQAIRAATEEGFKQYIREAERKRNAIPHFDRNGLFHIVDSPKYPVYEVDFGFGTPQAVRAEGFRFGAEVQILAGRLGSGSFDLFCALDPDTMHRLENDGSFLAC